MNTIDVVVLCIVNLLSFVIGAIIGQRVGNGKQLSLNPVKTIKEDIKESRTKKQEDLKTRQLQTNLANIENYDGTGLGQKQIPME